MIEEKSIELFGDESDGSDDDSDAEEGTFNVEIAAQVKSLKDTQKTLVREQGVLLKDFYTKVSGGFFGIVFFSVFPNFYKCFLESVLSDFFINSNF